MQLKMESLTDFHAPKGCSGCIACLLIFHKIVSRDNPKAKAANLIKTRKAGMFWLNVPLTTTSWRTWRQDLWLIVSFENLEERKIEPATFGLQDQHANHSATVAPKLENWPLDTGPTVRGRENKRWLLSVHLDSIWARKLLSLKSKTLTKIWAGDKTLKKTLRSLW